MLSGFALPPHSMEPSFACTVARVGCRADCPQPCRRQCGDTAECGSALREARDQVRKGFEREEILSGQLKEVELSEGEPFFDNVENLRVLRACLSFEV